MQWEMAKEPLEVYPYGSPGDAGFFDSRFPRLKCEI